MKILENNHIIVLFLLSFLFASQHIISQDVYQKLTDEEINNLKKVVEYSETKGSLVMKEFDLGEDEDVEVSSDFGMIGDLFTMIMYLLIVLLIFFIIYLIFSSIKLEKKIEKTAPIEIVEEEDIEAIDTDDGLRKALAAGDYREAVRMLFIKLLQSLVEEKSIKWRPEKTNRDYLKEMKSHKLYNKFRILVLAYDTVWYGEENIDKNYFEYLQTQFDDFALMGSKDQI